MSGIELKTDQRSAEAQIGSDGTTRYSCYYSVRVSSANDGPEKVLQYLANRGIYWGAIYSYGNDVNNTVFCDGIQVRRRPRSVEWWDVVVAYGPTKQNLAQTPEGQPSAEPNQWAWLNTMGYATWQEPTWEAINRTPFPHPDQLNVLPGAYTRDAGTSGPVVNSANVILDPTLMRDVYDRVWQITTYSRTYDGLISDDYMGHINSDRIQISAYMQSLYAMESQVFEARTVKCTNATAAFKVLDLDGVRIP